MRNTPLPPGWGDHVPVEMFYDHDAQVDLLDHPGQYPEVTDKQRRRRDRARVPFLPPDDPRYVVLELAKREMVRLLEESIVPETSPDYDADYVTYSAMSDETRRAVNSWLGQHYALDRDMRRSHALAAVVAVTQDDTEGLEGTDAAHPVRAAHDPPPKHSHRSPMCTAHAATAPPGGRVRHAITAPMRPLRPPG